MEKSIIRKATKEDLETLYKFEQGVIDTERAFDPTLKTGAINYYDLPGMIDSTDIELLVAESDDTIVASGYARIENAKIYLQHSVHAYLGFMYVVPEYRGKGINQKIIQALIEWANSREIFEIRLDVYYENISAIKAYEKIGFSRHMIEMRAHTK